MTRDQVRRSENKRSRIAVRVSLGALMFGLFCAFVRAAERRGSARLRRLAVFLRLSAVLVLF
jgi:hypothetical protein